MRIDIKGLLSEYSGHYLHIKILVLSGTVARGSRFLLINRGVVGDWEFRGIDFGKSPAKIGLASMVIMPYTWTVRRGSDEYF